MLANGVVSFEWPGPGILIFLFLLMHLSCEDDHDIYSVSYMWYTCLTSYVEIICTFLLCHLRMARELILNKVLFCSVLLFQINNCAKLFRNPCINIEVTARSSSVYDHFITWPSSVTLTFNLLEQMLKLNICARLF